MTTVSNPFGFRTRAQLREDIVNEVFNATTDPKRGCVETQLELANAVNCSPATITAEMPEVIKLSTKMHPGYCVNYNWYDGYRLIDIQTKADMIYSRGRWRKAFTALDRGVHEIDLTSVGPVASAAVFMAEAALMMLEKALEKMDELINA